MKNKVLLAGFVLAISSSAAVADDWAKCDVITPTYADEYEGNAAFMSTCLIKWHGRLALHQSDSMITAQVCGGGDPYEALEGVKYPDDVRPENSEDLREEYTIARYTTIYVVTAEAPAGVEVCTNYEFVVR